MLFELCRQGSQPAKQRTSNHRWGEELYGKGKEGHSTQEHMLRTEIEDEKEGYAFLSNSESSRWKRLKAMTLQATVPGSRNCRN